MARLDKENEELKQLVKDLNGRAKGIKRILKKCMLPGSFCIKNWEEFYFNIEPDIRYAFLEAYNSVEQIKNYEQKMSNLERIEELQHQIADLSKTIECLQE